MSMKPTYDELLARVAELERQKEHQRSELALTVSNDALRESQLAVEALRPYELMVSHSRDVILVTRQEDGGGRVRFSV